MDAIRKHWFSMMFTIPTFIVCGFVCHWNLVTLEARPFGCSIRIFVYPISRISELCAKNPSIAAQAKNDVRWNTVKGGTIRCFFQYKRLLELDHGIRFELYCSVGTMGIHLFHRKNRLLQRLIDTLDTKDKEHKTQIEDPTHNPTQEGFDGNLCMQTLVPNEKS